MKNVLKKVLVGVCVCLMLFSVGCSNKSDNVQSNNQSKTASTDNKNVDDGKAIPEKDDISFKNIELNFWNGFTGADGKGMQKIVDGFNAEYDGKIHVQTQIMPWDTYYEKIITAVTSGQAPDVGIMHVDKCPKFAKKNVLLPLDQYTSSLGLVEDEFIKTVWNAGIFEGKRYGIPLDVHPLGLYYNMDLLKEAGFDAPPTNMDEFMEMAKAMTKDTDGDGEIDQWGFAMPALWPSQQIYWTALHQFGGQSTTEDGMTPLYTSDEAVEALEFLVNTAQKDGISPKDIQQDGEVTLFKQGKLGFHLNGIWMIAGFDEQEGLNYGTAPVPQWGKQKAVWAGSHNFVLYKQRKEDLNKQEAAMVFVDYIVNNSMEWAKAGQVPAKNSVRNSEEFKALDKQMGFAKQADYIVFPPVSPFFDYAWSPSGEAITKAVLGEMTPREALEEAAAKGEMQVEEVK